MSPWVTGGTAADALVVAATLVENGQPTDRELLLAVPADLAGITIRDPLPLVALTASSTGPVEFERVEVSRDWLIAGPAANVMASGVGGSTGGYETSALALGLARAAIDFLSAESAKRADLAAPLAALTAEHSQLVDDLWRWSAAKSPPSRRCHRRSHRRPCRSVSGQIRSCYGPLRPRSRPPREPATWPATRPGGGVARRCFSWSGVVRNRSQRPTFANWRASPTDLSGHC